MQPRGSHPIVRFSPHPKGQWLRLAVTGEHRRRRFDRGKPPAGGRKRGHDDACEVINASPRRRRDQPAMLLREDKLTYRTPAQLQH